MTKYKGRLKLGPDSRLDHSPHLREFALKIITKNEALVISADNETNFNTWNAALSSAIQKTRFGNSVNFGILC